MTKKILVADDSITIQKIVAMAFESENAVVKGVSDGKAAFDRLAEFKPDIVLADVDMPGLTGFELSKKIKSSEEFSSIRVLLLASDFEEFNDKLFEESRADDHISKPFKSDDVVKKVKSLLSEETGGSEDDVLTLSDADVVESAEEQADTAFELSAADLLEETPESSEGAALALTAEDLVEEDDTILELSEDTLELPETDLELPPESLVEEEVSIPPVAEEEAPAPVVEEDESLDGLMDSAVKLELQSDEPALEEPPEAEVTFAEMEETTAGDMADAEPEDTVLDEVINHVETLRDKMPPQEMGLPVSELEPDECLAETGADIEEDMEELEMEFQGIAQSIAAPSGGMPGTRPKAASAAQRGEDIIPEPEDLLEKMAPASFARERGNPRPDLIGESLSYLSGSEPARTTKTIMAKPFQERVSPGTYGAGDDRFVQIVGEHVKNLLEKTLKSSIEKEIAEMGKTIQQTIREVVREVVPQIARAVIQEEIDKLRKQ